MKFIAGIPEKESVHDLENFSLFIEKGQPELCNFLKHLLGLDDIRIQTHKLIDIKKWLCLKELGPVNEVPGRDNEICLVSQIVVGNRLIAYYPYVLVGKFVLKYALAKNLYIRMTEAISDQLSACYLQGFYGGNWLFGDKFAQMLVANCVSTNLYDGIKFAPLIEKMEQLSVTTFEAENFTTGVIVTSNKRPYKSNSFTLLRESDIYKCGKREWFLADGKSSFYIMDSQACIRYIYTAKKNRTSNFIKDYFDNYYMRNGQLVEPDFVVRTIGHNEVSVMDALGKEFVKIENTWHYRYKRNLIEYFSETLGINEELGNAVLYYVLKCSREHISTIIWMPKDCSSKAIEALTTEKRVRNWKQRLNILQENQEAIIDKVLASDGAILINNNGEVLYESIVAKFDEKEKDEEKLEGTGDTAAKQLASNGIAIKVSQDGPIKIYAGNDKIFY